MANNIKGITIEVGGNTVGLTKALDGVNKQSNSLQKELREVEKLLKLDPKNTELLEQKQKLLGKSVETTKEKLEALKNAEKQVQQQVKEGKASEEQYRALQREIVKTEQELKRLEGSADGAEKGVNKLGNEAEKAGEKLQDVGDKVSGVGEKLLPVTGVVAGLGAASYKLAADMVDALGATDQIFGDASNAMQEWAKNLESYYGIASAEALEYGNMMGSMLQNIGGLTADEAAKQAQTLIELAGDLTAMYGGTTEDAVRALTGALKGNNTMLDNYGMAANDAMVKTKALEMGLYDGTGQMDLAAKQAATLALIIEQSGAAQGQAAREAEGASGSMRAIATEVKNLTASIGELLLPIITPLIQKVSEFVNWLTSLNDGAKKIILVIMGVAAAIGPILIILGTLISVVGNLTVAAAGLGITLNAMLGWVGLIALAITALVAAMALWISSSDDQVKQSEKLVEQAEQERQAYERLRQAQEEKTEASLSELAYTEKLWQELQTLTDENGNVTEANRARAQFIVGELNSALGSELEFIDGKVKGLQDEQAEIDNLIEKKRAQIYLEGLEPAYREAISNSLQKESSLREQETAIVEQQGKVAEAQAQLRAEQAQAEVEGNVEVTASAALKLEREKQILNNMQNAYLLDKENYKIYLEDKNDYESAAAAAMEGNYQALEDIVVGSTQRTYQTADDLVGKSKDDQIGILGEQYAGALAYLSDYAIKHKQGVEGYTADGLKEAQNYATSAKTEYEKVGGAVVDGTIEGMDKKKINVKNTIDALFKSIPEWARKILKIESPSKVMRDEVGKYIVLGVAQGIKDNEGALKSEMENLANGVKAQVKELQTYIDGIEKEIKGLGREKKAANKEGKAAIDELIQSKRDEIDSVKENIETLQDEQKAYEDRAKAYIEASELIKKGLTEVTDNIGLDKTRSSNTYKLWLAVYGEGATEAEKLQKQEESLTEQFNIQGETVKAIEAAYQLMVEHYGESYEGSRKLENQLLQERIAYEELYNSIIDVREARPEQELKETTETNDLDKKRSSDKYKLWLAVHGKTATEAEKLQKQEESLTEQYKIQGETVEDTEAAYQSMVEQNGESCEGSRKLENQLLQERIAYEELYNSIIDVREAKSELTENSAANLRAAQTNYGDFLAKNYKSLSNFGLSASDIFTTARKVSELDKAESAVKSITVNQNITTTAATPSEIREAARDGATLATKEAYA